MSRFFTYRVLYACLAHLARRLAFLAVLCALWPLLASVAPVPTQACREDNAGFVIRTTVSRDVPSNGTAITVPAGIAVAWSCVSRDEAEQELQRQIALIK
jgi:hypothetical protein